MRQAPVLALQSGVRTWTPHFIVGSVPDIDFARLQQLGIKACLVDLDNTIVLKRRFDISDSVKAALAAQPLPLYIATNRLNGKSLEPLATTIGARGIITPRGIQGKPAKAYFRRAAAVAGCRPDQLVMIGDRLLQDVWGAHRSGLWTIAVYNFGPAKGLDRIVTGINRLALRTLTRNYQ
jgi:HAD superfamily phosphatase (TIGR01668 family)